MSSEPPRLQGQQDSLNIEPGGQSEEGSRTSELLKIRTKGGLTLLGNRLVSGGGGDKLDINMQQI